MNKEQTLVLKEQDYVLKQEKFKRLAGRDLLCFTEYTKDDYETNWHHEELAKKLTAFARGDIRYLMVFMPPRHGKSELVSRRFPAFLHGLYPDCEIMAVSYLDSLAGDMTLDVQKIIDTPKYQELFPETKINPPGTPYSTGTRNSSEHNIIGHRGKYRGQGVGGSFTGKGANFIIIDDPIKGRDIADSVVFRERLWDFYNNDLFSRLETNLETGRRGQILITQTRWHEDDLSGRLIDQMHKDHTSIQWEIISYPAIRTDDFETSDPRKIGEALWPRKFNLEQLSQMKASMGPRAWSSLYQQSPILDGGGLFNQSMFEFRKPFTSYDFTFITADTAYNDKRENDFTVFSAWGFKNDLFLIDVWRQRIKSSEIEGPALNFIAAHSKKYGYRGAYIEPKGHGIYLNQRFRRIGLYMPSEEKIQEFFEDRRMNKVERANNAIPYLSTKKVYINDDITIKEELLSELLAFPKGKHDDFVDTLVDAVKMAYNDKPSILNAFMPGNLRGING